MAASASRICCASMRPMQPIWKVSEAVSLLGSAKTPMAEYFSSQGAAKVGGPVLASTVYASGAAVPLAGFIQPRIEAEIVFVMGDRLAGPGVSVADASRATSGVAAAMEIIDSRIAGWRIRLADTVADLASNGAVVISSRIVPLAGLDTRLIGMMLTRNGELADTGAGAAALGDPLTVVAWLANTLGEHGIALEPGHLVMTGSMHAAVPMAAGDVFRAEFDRLGPVTVRVTDGDAPSQEDR